MSATYNHRLKEHLGIGGGVQVLQYTYSPHTALFADLRKYRIKNKHIWLLFVDLGFDIFKDKGPSSYDRADNAVYTSAGFGYFHAINTKGNGAYATIRLAIDSRILSASRPNQSEGKYFDTDGIPVFAIGFKF